MAIQGSRRPLTHYEEATINLTPLLDVIFVILVIFMIVAPMLNLDQIELASGGSTETTVSSNQAKTPVQIHVKQDNSISINGQPVDPHDLPAILNELKRIYPQAIPLVFHDRRAHFGTYQHLKTELEDAGFDEMHIVLKPS